MTNNQTEQPVTVEQEYERDARGLFCAHCGKTAIRHVFWHGKRLCDLPVATAIEALMKGEG